MPAAESGEYGVVAPMMNAETFGGIGVAIMLHRTAFEIAVDDMRDGLNGVSAKLNKLMHGDLRKAVFVDQMAALQDILADMPKLEEIAARRDAALADFEAWMQNKPYATAPRTGIMRDYGSVMVATKSCGAEHGAELSELWPSRKPQVDPITNVTDAMLARRFQGRE
jgi:hypothetical protein